MVDAGAWCACMDGRNCNDVGLWGIVGRRGLVILNMPKYGLPRNEIISKVVCGEQAAVAHGPLISQWKGTLAAHCAHIWFFVLAHL